MMRCLKCRVWLVVTIFATCSLAGCGGDGSTTQTEHVEGVVTLDGTPVSDATVTFAPVDEKKGVMATGTTDEEGRYTLTIIRGEAGAGTAAGEYYVGVVKNKLPPEDPDTDDPNYGKEDPNPYDDPKITYIVPQKYNDPQKSGIKATVEAGKENDIPIKLKTR